VVVDGDVDGGQIVAVAVHVNVDSGHKCPPPERPV